MKNYCPGKTNEYLCLHPGFTYAGSQDMDTISEGSEEQEVECCYLVLLLSYTIDHVLINLALHYWEHELSSSLYLISMQKGFNIRL